jgi:5-methylcytosine-specific restriction endonuclease McrA
MGRKPQGHRQSEYHKPPAGAGFGIPVAKDVAFNDPEDDLFDHPSSAQLASAAGLTSGLASGLSSGLGPIVLPESLTSKVLVLNRHFVAVRVISAKRAFCMLCRELAEVIHVDHTEGGTQYHSYDFASWAEAASYQSEFERDKHDWVKTVRYEIAVPRIIRLLGYDRLPEQGVKLNRRNLFARDRNQCQYCGRHFPTADLSIDHVHPRSLGGKETWENLVCACIKCNARKGGRTPEQASIKLIRKPERPKRNPLITLRLGNAKYQSWKQFLDEAYWSVELR